MADERELSGSDKRPVEPQVIDLEAEDLEGPAESFEAEPAAEQPPESSESRRAWYRSITATMALAGAAIILAVGVAAFVVLDVLRPKAGGQETITPRLEALEGRSESIELGVKELTAAIHQLAEQQSTASQSSPTAEPEALKQQMQQIEDRLGRLSEAVESIGMSIKTIESGQNAQRSEIESAMGRIGELQSRLAVQNQQQPSVTEDGKAGAELAAALLKLKTAVEEGRTFEQELETLRGMAPEARGLKDLASYSKAGVANIANLRSRLEAIIAELRMPAKEPATAPQPSGLWGMFKSKAASLVSVRKLEEAKWLDVGEDALRRLDSGDLKGAGLVLNSVEGARPASIEAWLADAAARLEADRAVEELSASVLEQLGGGS